MTTPAPFDPRNATAREVAEFHRQADTDASFFSIHHTLGIGQNQSSPGDHIHDGKSSKTLSGYVSSTAPINVTGSRGGNAALASLLTALATKGIITNSTTA